MRIRDGLGKSHLAIDHIAEGAVPAKQSGEHPHEHGNSLINVVVHADFVFVVMKPVQSSAVLLQCAPPGYGHGQKERVQAGIIKSLPDVASGGENDTWSLVGNGSKLSHRRFPLFLTHAAAQHDDMF